MDTELVLDVADVHAPLALVVDEHGKATAVAGTFLAAGQDQVNIGVTVGDEALHTVQQPATLLLGPGGLQHHALQVGPGIRLGQVHGHGLAGADTGDEFLTLLFGTELIEGFAAALQAPDILETGIGRGDNLAGHAENGLGHIQTAVTARHGNAPQASLAHGFHILHGLGRVDHTAVLQMRAFQIHALGIGGEDIRGDITGDFQHPAVILDGVLVIHGRIGIRIFVCKITFLQFHDATHQGMVQMESNLGMIGKIICHIFLIYLLFCL